MNYQVWDAAIQDAIASLPTAEVTSRSQRFLRQFPTALTQFRQRLSNTDLAIPLADFQKHPTFLLRWLLADWKDEEKKVLRIELNDIMGLATKAIQATQRWRAGEGDNWKTWGFKDMDDLYNNLKTPPDQERKLQTWFFQRFCGLDNENHPIHYELLPNTYEQQLIHPLSIRRIVNNEHTLRHRILLLNPPPEPARDGTSIDSASSTRPDVLSNPILGATWVLDARNLSLWYSSAIYRTATALIDHSTKITSAHYPEQGYRAVVLNLGVVFGSLYNVAIKAMPATTQATTRCYIGKDVMEEIMGSWEKVPGICRNPKQTELTPAEEERYRFDRGPFVV
ncbi:protein of unknown function [Taphrina deformans PYCC 5710]|uniref:Uncharacterized protein n=1 Tax=Taphrina deformans (strain PYCC 5710 / ATCC 11124 / CBS 356.35 / IMI 108563 / JCM 9778 / NBRC 8474) TaxID=1097556 RepID=R4XEN2_TAPDE|nr:protein of unknown function [Taphrina deformans PYCC 5710]|eukprot:CCG82931.1 protein of unknown function [Taphrina deformans PYCC 5710]